MVGYAYSCDFKSDYNYIIIKSFDFDDFSFVDESAFHQVYRVCRKTGAVEPANADTSNYPRHLSYNNITSITKILTNEEYSKNYPQVLSWSINPSGICEKKKTEDLHTAWPITPYHLEGQNGYINITKCFFDKNPLYLKSSFVCDVLNEVTFCLGLYMGDGFTVLGDEVFCSFDVAFLMAEILHKESFYQLMQKFFGKTKSQIKRLNPKNILKNLKRPNINLCCSWDFGAKELCLIKKQCIAKVIDNVYCCLKNEFSADDLIKKLNAVFDDSLDKIFEQKYDFALCSGGRPYSDMNYLTFDELMMAFSFGNFKGEISEIIKINKNRKHNLKNINIPLAIYDGMLYFDY